MATLPDEMRAFIETRVRMVNTKVPATILFT